LSGPLEWLFGLEQFGIKLGLENITRLVEAMGRPDRSFKTVHIAGTNGKGSTTAVVDTALRAAGYRSARYTSPHLVHLSERFVIAGRAVEPPALVDAVSAVRATVDRLLEEGALGVPPTFFEVTTAVAFELFRRAAVDIAVCEVGLGGRLDATNVVMPEVTAITSIGRDHQQYLGDTLRDIAIEKGGIIKPGIPVVVGRMDPAASEAIAAIAHERHAPIVEASIGDFANAPLGLRGAHQAHNAAVAVSILQTLSRRGVPVGAAAIGEGLATAEWAGRLDIRKLPDGREVLMDAAHNADGAAALARFLETSPFRGSPLVFGVMRDKNVDDMLRALAPVVGPVLLTRASTPRARDPVELAARLRAVYPRLPAAVADSPSDAVRRAWQLSPRIIVAGSIFLLGDVMKDAGWS
jgi:dihydrofolate synthase / folylpolyglutamate synthase